MKLLIATAGSGGHLFPALGFAQNMQNRLPKLEILFAGHGLSTNPFFLQQPNRIDISAAQLDRSPLKLLRSLSANVMGVAEGITLIKKRKPKLIVGFGSYHTAPLLSAAVLTRTPFVLFAADAVPGRVVRLFAPFANRVGLFFPEACGRVKGTAVAQMLPLRENLTLPLSFTSHELKRRYGLNSDEPVLLVIGGSQGAQKLNGALPAIAAQINPKVQFLHMAGSEAEKARVEKLYRDRGVQASVHAFEAKMECAYGAADAVVARAGASTIAEILHFQLPAVLVPYPHAQDDHQQVNAKILENLGCGCMVQETKLEEMLVESVSNLFDPIYRSKMALAQIQRHAELSHNHLTEYVFKELSL